MIPHKLIIKNFLSYGETPAVITFDPYNLICLSGKNGNGKSALLDALTWAIWGHARKISGISKPDEGLLRLGSSRMLVTIEFSFNNQYYRIRREYARAANKAVASLDFEIRQPSHGFFSSLTDKTIRATQEKINQLLGIDYETFVNSSFIRQGHSNEFSKKSPKERKEILGSILGLDHYQQLQSAALEKIRTLQVEQQMIERLDTISQQEIEQHKQNTELNLEEQEQVIRDALIGEKNKEQELSKELHILETTAAQQKEWLTKKNEETIEIEKTQKKIRAEYQTFQKLHKEVLLEKNNQNKEKLKKELEAKIRLFLKQQKEHEVLQKELESRQNELQLLQQSDEKLKKEIQAHIDPLQQKEVQCKTEIRHLIEQKEKCSKELLLLHDAQKKVEQRSEILERSTKDLSSQEALFEKRKQFYHFLQQKYQLVEKMLSELHPKKEQLEQQTSAHCPLCDQLVTAARKKFLHNKMLKEEQKQNYQKNKIIRLMKSLKELLISEHKIMQTKKEEKKELEQLELKKQEGIKQSLTYQKEEETLSKILQTKEKELEKISKELLSLKKTIEKESPEIKIKKEEILAIKQTLTTLNYQATAHNELTQHLTSLYQSSSAEIVEQKKTEKAVKKAEIQHLIIVLKKAYKTVEALSKQLAQQKIIAPLIQKKELQKKELFLSIEQKQKELEKIVAEKARAAHELLRIKKIETEIKTRAQKKENLSFEIQEYQLIAQAFSKNGIPALLIEEVIPELEAEANLLLQKLTNNQAQIFIESVRDLKKGGVKETLDIHISDSSGIRPYEMFSGGEAFRIDFALRIAISKLLARRAGTPLQTLIIDEGFGSQDEEGLQKIMDALYKIQSDFAKIIIVSHLPMMKDNFPVHFIIEKGALGSQVFVEERG